MIFTENHHVVSGLDPVADAFAGTVYSDVFNLEAYGHIVFVLFCGVGATGTSTITVEACDDVVPTTVSAIPFHYRQQLTKDIMGALTAAAAAGFTTTAGSAKLVFVEVDAKALAGDGNGYGYIRLKLVESVDSPVLGGILAILCGPRYGQSVPVSVIV